MPEDVAPALAEAIEADFDRRIRRDSRLKALMQKVEAGRATYEEAAEYAWRIGEHASQSLAKHLRTEVLPDGRLYYNIAERTVRPLLKKDYALVQAFAARVQTILNREAGLGLKPQVPEINESRVKGIIDRLSSAPRLEDIAWMLDTPVETFSQSIVDDFVQANAAAQAKVGLHPKVRRISTGNCCKWCSQLAGSYDYGRQPADFFRRHANCHCLVTYHPGDGRRQNVHTRQWEAEKAAEERRQRAEDLLHPRHPVTGKRYTEHALIITEKQAGKKLGKHARDFGLDPQLREDRERFLQISRDIVERAEERVYGEWRGQAYPVLFHIRGGNVVIESDGGHYVTTLQGGVTNERVKKARKRKV